MDTTGNAMSNSVESALREQLLLTHGRLLSGFSHDLKNHVAIINESKGLLQDYIEMGKICDPELCSRLQDILSKMDKRTDSIAIMTHHLNSFAHRFDTASTTFDLNELIVEQLFFLQRSVRLKQLNLSTEIPKTASNITSNPSLIQYLFLHLFDTLLTSSQEDDRLHIAIMQQHKQMEIRLVVHRKTTLPSATKEPLLTPEIQLCLQKIGAHITYKELDTTSSQTAITLPLEI